MAIEEFLEKETEEESEKVNKRWEKGFTSIGLVFFKYSKYRAIMTVEKHKNGKWKHVSVTLEKDMLPTWGDLVMVKNDFFGEKSFVVQVIPPNNQYVNEHDYSMHLWQYLSGPNWPIEKDGFTSD